MNFVSFTGEEDYDEVEFEDIIKVDNEKKDQIPKIEYDEITIKKYKAFRYRKMDPISYTEVEEDYAFKFEHIWDPYTGERKDQLDSDGPLYFDPDILINYFLTKILTKLWVQPSDEHGGYYQGYYDDGAGAGEDFYVAGRGHHPEWYLFRLPIIDCYLTKDHNKQYITFGPKLTDSEIMKIDELARKRPKNFFSLFNKNRPSLVIMKALYDKAISKKPFIKNIPENITEEELKNLYNRENRNCIDELVKIHQKNDGFWYA